MRISMENYNTSAFLKDLEQLNITLTQEQVNQFLQYYEMLVEKNKVMNLTAITEYDEVMKKHFIDSLSLVKAFSCKDKQMKVIDIGTGAGFPGIPLKIAFPQIELTLLDSLNKRILFLNEVIDALELKNVTTLHGRAEDYAKQKEFREQYDLCVSRAVANLSTLSEYCIPFVKKDGFFIPYKSEKMSEELEGATRAVKVLGGHVENQVSYYLPDSDIFRNLVMIKKIDKTPGKYPRKAGLPSKEPL